MLHIKNIYVPPKPEVRYNWEYMAGSYDLQDSLNSTDPTDYPTDYPSVDQEPFDNNDKFEDNYNEGKFTNDKLSNVQFKKKIKIIQNKQLIWKLIRRLIRRLIWR